MSRPLRLVPHESKVLLLMVLVLSLVFSALPSKYIGNISGPSMSSPRISGAHLALAPVASAAPYDEQVGITFTQDFSMLAFNVSAVSFIDNGIGPAYLVNGLTDSGYWYQVGLSYDWPMTNGAVNLGFRMNYEVFDPTLVSVYPYDHGGGIQNFNGTINDGDSVLLSLSFSQGLVLMQAKDWQTRAVALQSFTAFANNRIFLGLASKLATKSGFFSGLMTEQYHYGRYFGAGSPVTYSVSGTRISSAWMWMDEWNTNPNTFELVFAANTTSPVSLGESVGHYFSSNGTAEIASSNRFVMGLDPVTFPSLLPGSQGAGRPGHPAFVNIAIEDPQGATVKFENLTVLTSFGIYSFTLGAPFSFGSSFGQYNLTIILPANLVLGTYNLTVSVMSWSYLDTQAQVWIPLRLGTLNETFLATNTPPPSNPPSNPGSSPPSSNQGPSRSTKTKFSASLLVSLLGSTVLPIAGGYAALGLLAVALLLRQERRRSRQDPVFGLRFCTNCGREIAPETIACPHCNFPADVVSTDPRSLPSKVETAHSVF